MHFALLKWNSSKPILYACFCFINLNYNLNFSNFCGHIYSSPENNTISVNEMICHFLVRDE